MILNAILLAIQLYPSQIIFIRHGEKTNDDDVNLSPVGQVRAMELPNYFNRMITDGKFEKPDFIVAMKQKKKGKSSNRPVQTITPLADQLGLPIHHDFIQDETLSAAQIINQPSNLGAVVLAVSYTHLTLPTIYSV